MYDTANALQIPPAIPVEQAFIWACT